jgi:creatinine amidohydrolase
MTHRSCFLGALTTDEARAIASRPPTCVLLPVGSVEPHGPHLPLETDTKISEEAAARAAAALEARGVPTYLAPPLPYGVTAYAAGFSGALSVPADALTSLLRAVALGLLSDGWSHVCLVNNHLEPAHDGAVRAAVAGLAPGRTSVACPLTRRWARTLSDEFKRGNCHAGRYETSLVLAAGVPVRPVASALPSLETSLSEGIRAGKATFAAMGMDRAYTGAPAEATAAEGDLLYAKLAEMIVTEVLEGLGVAGHALLEAAGETR